PRCPPARHAGHLAAGHPAVDRRAAQPLSEPLYSRGPGWTRDAPSPCTAPPCPALPGPSNRVASCRDEGLLEIAMRIRWRGLELPSRVICNREKLTDTYGEFHVEPFERGFGHTVGNSLRRILLSSLEGSAVTKIKIQSVQHEFSSIPGMV